MDDISCDVAGEVDLEPRHIPILDLDPGRVALIVGDSAVAVVPADTPTVRRGVDTQSEGRPVGNQDREHTRRAPSTRAR